jgi:hypothetical protein
VQWLLHSTAGNLHQGLTGCSSLPVKHERLLPEFVVHLTAMLLRWLVLLQAFKLYHAIDSEVKDYEWRWGCTDHNVSRGHLAA